MAYINTKPELYSYLRRLLGSEYAPSELTDNNLDDIFNRSLKYFRDYSSDAVYEQNLLLSVNNNAREITLDTRIISINKVLKTDSISFDFGSSNLYAFSLYSPISDFLFSGINVDTSSIVSYRENYREIRNQRYNKVQYDFNPESNKIRLYEDLDQIFVNCLYVEDEADIYDNEFFLLLMERGCYQNYLTNISKFKGSTIANGLELNNEFFQSKYDELNQRIEDIKENEEFSFLKPIRVSNSE